MTLIKEGNEVKDETESKLFKTQWIYETAQSYTNKSAAIHKLHKLFCYFIAIYQVSFYCSKHVYLGIVVIFCCIRLVTKTIYTSLVSITMSAFHNRIRVRRLGLNLDSDERVSVQHFFKQ